MTLTFTVTPDPTNVPPRTMLEVEEDDTTRVLSSVAFFRDGVPLRFEPILSDRFAVAYDYDAPFDIEAVYRGDVVETSTAADWSETWASTTAWTGSGWTAGAGVVTSSTPAANIYRDVTTSSISKVEVTSPSNLTLQLADSNGTTVGSVTVLPSGQMVVAGNLGPASAVAGTGSFTVTLSSGSMTVSGTTPSAWSTTVALSTDPTSLPATRVRLVAPEVGTLAQYFSIQNPAVGGGV